MNKTKQNLILLLAFLAMSFTSVSSYAISAADQTAVTTAMTSGATSVALVVTGVIAIGAVLTGLGLIVKWLAK